MKDDTQPALKARKEAAYQRGWTLGAGALVVVPLALVIATPDFWTDDYPLAGAALVIGQIAVAPWLPVRVGEWMARRIK